ncbi:hypothetical protein GCM10011386_06660 [Parapedobacter defluvii]|uniref:SCP domain-containing protein n=1 Tax=Parapedobacter defluvii TaxID=2045106 RepID=A0ABQ1L4W3_9SPHI|nr:CAP domain-containing protein [Parapedobacter defluvii]GGC17456.1 hypothetical protein GCM10011386_06660 [Parapedobacter defluvii]
MLKRLVPAVFCLLAVLSACEPNVSESLEPVLPKESSDHSLGGEKDDPADLPVENDTTISSMLNAVNALRQTGCDCGEQSMPATGKLVWNVKLYEAALNHAKDMHANNYFSHTSPSGENVYQRLVASGYISNAGNILAYGENIAFGDFDLDKAIQKWLTSPSHCANMMRDTYEEMAIAHEGNYWVQVFGAKRK